MSHEKNKAAVRRWIDEVFNKGNLTVVDELVDPDWVDHNPVPDQKPGIEGAKQAVRLYRTGFPDMVCTIDEQLADGDKVVTRFTVRATHRGEYMGTAPSGRRIDVKGITIDRFAHGKAIETWTEFDALGMLQQIGAIPEPAAAMA